MAWTRPQGWQTTEREPSGGRFTQIIRTVMEVLPGGVIRFGKTGPDDDAHTGFWLGVSPDGVARFAVGGPAFWLKWTGTALLVRGRFSTLGGGLDEAVRWVGEDGGDIAYLLATEQWGHQLVVGVPRTHAAGDPGQIDLFVDGDLGANLRLRLSTARGAGLDGTRVEVIAGNQVVFSVDGAGNVWAAGDLRLAGTIGAGDLADANH